MKKAEAGATAEYQGKTYYFCCAGAKDKFLKDPAQYTQAMPEAGVKYVCPMCKGVESDKPGKCPKCGMDLVKKAEPQNAAAPVAAKSCCGGHKHAAALEKKREMAGRGHGAGAGCGMMKAKAAEGCACPICSADVELKVENVKDGVVVTMTAKKPELVKAILDYAAKMKDCRAKCLEAAKKEEPKK
jgi:YHS domain-containing protein